MSQTKQDQGAAAAKPKARKDWEMFWRIIAVLMLLVVAWVVWVLYQITPRSVVTPLAYENQSKPITTQPPVAATPVAAPAAPENAAAQRAMDQAQAAAQSGAHQASADVQAATPASKSEPVKGEGLKLATEISLPPVDKPGAEKARQIKPEAGPALPAATGASGKDRP